MENSCECVNPRSKSAKQTGSPGHQVSHTDAHEQASVTKVVCGLGVFPAARPGPVMRGLSSATVRAKEAARLPAAQEEASPLGLEGNIGAEVFGAPQASAQAWCC